MRRHVYYYTYLLDGSSEQVEHIFRGDPGAWLPPPAELSAEGWLVDLHADGVLVAPLALQHAEVQVGPPCATRGGLVRAMSWHATRADRLFPVFTGDLELTPLPITGWQVAMVGTYRPPLSVVGGAADRALGHRVAEACVRRFALDVADRLLPATLPM
jgi:hypothetical protein